MTHLQPSFTDSLISIEISPTSSHSSFLFSLKSYWQVTSLESIVSFIPTILIITKASFLINPNYFIIRTCWFALIFMTSNPFKVTTLPFIILLLSLSFLILKKWESSHDFRWHFLPSQLPSISSLLLADSCTLSSHIFMSVDLHTCTWQSLV